MFLLLLLQGYVIGTGSYSLYSVITSRSAMKAVFLSVGICMWFQLGYLLRATYVVIGIDSKKQIENRIGKNQFLKRLIVYQKRLSISQIIGKNR